MSEAGDAGTTGVLLMNVGTPDAPRTPEVRRYLAEFLGDPRMLSMPAPLRWLLLHGVILRTRPRKSAAAYAKIWTDAGSPQLVHGRDLAESLGKALGERYRVALGMRYGNPGIGAALAELADAGVARILALPMFPQWSDAATGSAVARVQELHARQGGPPLQILRDDFYDDPGFLEAFADVARPVLAEFAPDHVLLSYHGLPESQVRASDPTGRHCLAAPTCCDALVEANQRCYRAHCFATSRGLIEGLGLDPANVSTAFQSRLLGAWIQPFTDERLPELADQGVRRLAVLCPAFVADCLETLEEIEIRAAEQWQEVGGEALRLVPSLNGHPSWVAAVADWIRAG